MMFVHFPTPHPFPIYNRREHNFHLRGTEDYFDNFALVDRTLGELRRALEQAGLWDQTLDPDHRRPRLSARGLERTLGMDGQLDRFTGAPAPVTVPFILKLPGQNSGRVVDKPFSNVLSGILASRFSVGQFRPPPKLSPGWMGTAQARPNRSPPPLVAWNPI